MNFFVKFASVQIKLSIFNLIENNTEVSYSITNSASDEQS